MGKREDHKRRTRQALVDAGLELFRARGFDDTRVQDIVDQAGVSPATFFNYFPSKDALLEAQAEQTADLYAALLRHELDRVDTSVTDRLAQITRAIAYAFEADPEISTLMVTRTPIFFGSTGAKADKDRHAQQLLAELFTQGQQAGEIDPEADPLQLAELCTAVITLTSVNWLTGWFGETKQRLQDRLLEATSILLNGARPATSSDHQHRTRRLPADRGA
jgi:AcrR family transcriptional regulator